MDGAVRVVPRATILAIASVTTDGATVRELTGSPEKEAASRYEGGSSWESLNVPHNRSTKHPNLHHLRKRNHSVRRSIVRMSKKML